MSIIMFSRIPDAFKLISWHSEFKVKSISICVQKQRNSTLINIDGFIEA